MSRVHQYPSTRPAERSGPRPSRRAVLAAAAGTAAVAPLLNAQASQASPVHSAGKEAGSTRVGAGTDFSVRVSPDGKQLALDCSASCGSPRSPAARPGA